MTYVDDCCVIEGCTLRTLIGVGEWREGVYYIKHSISQVNVINIRCLWDKHLKHPFSEVVFLLPSRLGMVCGLSKHKDEVCEIYFCARQTHN